MPTSSFLKCADSLSASKKHRSAHSSDLRNTMVTREARGCSGAKAPPPPRALWVTSFHWSDPVGARPLRTPNDKAFLAHSAFFHMDLCANTCLGMCANTCLGMCANNHSHVSVCVPTHVSVCVPTHVSVCLPTCMHQHTSRYSVPTITHTSRYNVPTITLPWLHLS